MAPPIGVAVDSDSGISGECIRSAATLVCNEAREDDRVDAEVCYSLGIRSIAVVPLRGRMGVFGILEAFSAKPAAFDTEKINSLIALAEITELAYEREVSAPAQTPAADRSAMFAPPPVAFTNKIKAALDSSMRYWVVGAAVVALLVIALVVRMSWRQTGAEIAASSSASHPVSAQNIAATSPQPIPALKPDASIPVRQVERGQNKIPLKNASDIQPADNAGSTTSIKLLPSEAKPAASPSISAPNTDGDAPPAVEFASTDTPNQLVQLSTTSEQLPQFGAAISQGYVAPALVQKVNPMYPQQARVQKITGSVVIDATIGPDGSVRKIAVVSGVPILASAAANAVREWRYTPAMLDGKRTEAQQRVTVVFSLP